MKFTYKRKLAETAGAGEAEVRLSRLRNAYQNPARATDIVRDDLGADPCGPIGSVWIESQPSNGVPSRSSPVTQASVSPEVMPVSSVR